MECAICFEEKHHFKVLNCDHTFCSECIEDISSGKLEASCNESANLKGPVENEDPATAPVPDTQSKGSVGKIECPKCRQVTELPAAGNWTKLPPRYYGNLLCSQCDELKAVDEFRWCHSCAVSVCSRCYVDKHVTKSEDGTTTLGLHSATKWDSNYPAVRYCLQQLLSDIEHGREKASKAKEYVRSYLEGLQEYLCVEIDQKTKSCENDHRQVLTTLSEAYGIDLRGVEPMIDSSRSSYHHMISPLYQLIGRQGVKPPQLHKQKYRINSVPYKDLARHLLSTEKDSLKESSLFFDSASITRKLAGESMLIGSNVMLIGYNVHPSDLCLLPTTGDSKVVVMIDYELGVYLFKYQSMQLQGPLPLRQPYARFSHVGVVGEGEKSTDPISITGQKGGAKVMVTCQCTPNGPWSYILIHIHGTNQEHIRINNNNHFGLPKNENMHLMGSQRSLFGLSTATSQKLWRFNGLECLEWKELYTVAPQTNPKPYCRLGPVCDYNDHTEVLITNGHWQSIDIIKFGWPNDKLWSVKRIELASLIPEPAGHHSSFAVPADRNSSFAEPALFPCYGAGTESAIIVDKKQPFLAVFERKARRSFVVAKFAVKLPVKVLQISPTSLLLIVQHKDNPSVRSLELYA